MLIKKNQIVLNTLCVAVYSKSFAQGSLILSRFSVPMGRGESETERPWTV